MAFSLIDHKSAPNGSGQFEFTSLVVTSYHRLILLLDGLQASTDGAFVYLRLSVGGTLYSAGYRYRTTGLSSSGTSNDASQNTAASGTFLPLVFGSTSSWGIGNASTKSGMVKAEISNLGNDGMYKTVFADAVTIGSTGALLRQVTGGHLEQTAAIDGLTILASTGTLTAGKATLYGLTTS